ncbi:MAG: HAMP domain-containing histidine kinase [Lachnospiraceae bacterium]|nr:HAMP domain-containing histidine kinase [Lachnospiraceae bacterium]
MKAGRKLRDSFTIRTVRKKILMISKLAGILLILSYILSVQMELGADLSFILWMLLVTAIVLLVDVLMGRFISKPISKLNQAARRMAELDFAKPCVISSKDEFGELSVSLDIMAENLQQAIAKLKAANIQLEKEVEQEKRLLAERKELVDHLSHEMKTPLGVIRAYAEGLQDETDESKKQKYSSIIIEETERMGNLITTLLDLSALENGASRLLPERFDCVEFLETVAGRLLIDTPDADFELQYEIPEHKVYVYTDKSRMEQVLDNLIINAKSNVQPGGILKISLIENAGSLHFTVFNQGEPIPQEALSKIWTKFYRGRRSEYSGSGLGLAIVAQILSMQDLKYGVENMPDGVLFYFSIPIVK